MVDSVVEEIKRKLDIVEVIGSYIKLQKVGINYRAVSPFHTEKNPSFFVSPAKQIWHDFSSGQGGDMFTFVQAIENIEFVEALRILAKRAGIELQENPEAKKNKSLKDRQFEICELACKFFEKQTQSVQGRRALDYLMSRAMKTETIKEWRIGFAPDTWSALGDFLIKYGFSKGEIEQTGLIIRKPSGEFYDRFRLRIMFPIFDSSSRVVGFTGRVLSKEQEEKGMAKYMNTPNTLIYDKSTALYGIQRAKINIMKEDACIVVEGQMDTIMSHQAGVGNVVASSGTALTQRHLEYLKKITKNIILAFDMDLGGNTAMDRGIKMALAFGFNVYTLTMPAGDKDPADVVKENPQKWQEIASKRKSIMDFYCEVAFSRYDISNIEGKKNAAEMILPVIKRLTNKIEKDYWVQQLSAKLSIKESTLLEQMAQLKEEKEQYAPSVQAATKAPQLNKTVAKTRKDMLEERIVSILLHRDDFKNKVYDEDVPMFSEKYREILASYRSQADFSVEKIPDANFMQFLKDLVFQREIEEAMGEKIDPEQELNVSLREYRVMNIRQQMQDLQLRIKNAEICKDASAAASLCNEFQALSEKLTKLI